MGNDQALKTAATQAIEQYLGSYASGLYKEYYKDKPVATVKLSLRELLSEVIGENRADEVMKEFEAKYQS